MSGIWTNHWVVRRDLMYENLKMKGYIALEDLGLRRAFFRYYYRPAPNRYTSPGLQYILGQGGG